MIVELPILFTRVNTAGTSIALEDAVYARKQTRAYARVPSVDAWVRTYMRPSEAEYTAMPLGHFPTPRNAGPTRLAAPGFVGGES